MMKLRQGGIEQTAVHNHLLHEPPRVLYTHTAGHGDPAQMAKGVHDALALTKTPGPDKTQTPAAPADLGFDRKQVEQILGHAGKVNGGILQVTVPRAEKITDSRMEVPPSMGVDGGFPASGGLELPAHRRRESRHHRGLRTARQGREPGDQSPAREWD